MSYRGDNIRNNISNEYEKTPGFLVYDLTEACGQEMDLMDKNIESNLAKLDVTNLKGDELNRFVSQRKGITRKEATRAVGFITVNGNGTVSAGDLFETELGVQFEATEDVNVVEMAEVPIMAVLGGNVGNVGAETITQFPVTIAGIVSCVNEDATTEGYDAESDESLLDRYLRAIRTPSSSGNKFDYENWALEVRGVGNVAVFPLGHGNNTVDVVITDSLSCPASDLLVEAVQNYIDPGSTGKGEGVAPIGAKCYVSSATKTDINISVKVTFRADADVVTAKAKIETVIKAYLKDIAFTGKSVSVARIGNCIIDTDGVIDYENLTVNGGTANIPIAERYVAVLGGITYAS